MVGLWPKTCTANTRCTQSTNTKLEPERGRRDYAARPFHPPGISCVRKGGDLMPGTFWNLHSFPALCLFRLVHVMQTPSHFSRLVRCFSTLRKDIAYSGEMSSLRSSCQATRLLSSQCARPIARRSRRIQPSIWRGLSTQSMDSQHKVQKQRPSLIRCVQTLKEPY